MRESWRAQYGIWRYKLRKLVLFEDAGRVAPELWESLRADKSLVEGTKYLEIMTGQVQLKQAFAKG